MNKFPARIHFRFAWASLISGCALACGQTADGVHGHVFRDNALGLTYNFPEKFRAQAESEVTARDSSQREHMILQLWDNPQRQGSPRMSFLYDREVRAADLSMAETANNYLQAVRQMWAGVKGAKIYGPTKIFMTGYALWRLDLWRPDREPHCNAAVVIPLRDRRVLGIQVNAPSQSELDAEVDSLREVHFDK